MAEEYGLKVVVKPAVEPIDVETFKLYGAVDHDAADALIRDVFIPAARERCEGYANRAYLAQTLELTLNGFRDPWNGRTDAIQLPRPPLVSVESVKYLDANGDERTVDPNLYRLDVHGEPGRLLLKYGQAWPTPQDGESVVTIRYVAGYGAAAANVPAHVRDAVYLATAQRFEHREEVVTGTIVTELPVTARNLLRHDRVHPY